MLFEEYVTNQIGLPESDRLKYEALLPSSSELGRLICAFSNTNGGIIMLGMLSKNNKISVKGLSADFQVNVVLANAISKLSPAPSVQSGFVTYQEKQLFVIKVEKSDQTIAYNQTAYGIKSKKIYKLSQALGSDTNAGIILTNGKYTGLKNNHILQASGKSIFISYQWHHKVAANNLYAFLKANGYVPAMDDHQLTYKDSISTFMESIRASDFAVLIISDEYLKSENCMIEVLHVLKDRNSKNKILPIRHEDVKIFKTADRIKYVEFWKTQVKEREKMLDGIDPTNAIEELKKLRIAKQIHQDISDFLSGIADMITNTIEEQEKTAYQNIINFIEANKN
ncbi:TIR domain-containing protein [Mucilaginibacter aquariorum]|uniref:TIR domain-containing protein n=1 Tax=Mucilaginibacter aquariorum TaxID=2967225 RepID=A0ABT1T650_9SPHI|nr:TIR domain-containing protein [Mucilaginibacter aquariorum]MCQ6960107.1 TIR domain-containing protein [Mucilaginibacter aquariorum]